MGIVSANAGFSDRQLRHRAAMWAAGVGGAQEEFAGRAGKLVCGVIFMDESRASSTSAGFGPAPANQSLTGL